MSRELILERLGRFANRMLCVVLCLSIAALPSARAQPAPSPDTGQEWLDELTVWHSNQLGCDYQLAYYARFEHGMLAARIASRPEANSAATRIRRSDTGQLITLEPGDLVVAMDEMAFFNRADFDGHVGDTSIYIRDSRTGQFIVGRTLLPPSITVSQQVRVGSTLDSAIDPVWWNDQNSEPFARNQAELRSLLLQGIRDGDVTLEVPKVRQADGSVSRYWFAVSSFSGRVHETVAEQALVESLRHDLGDPVFNQWMAAVLPNVERLIDRQLTLLNNGQRQQIAIERLDQQIEFQYCFAVFSAALVRGQPIPRLEPGVSPAPQAPLFFGRLFSSRNAVEILYMPRLNWWIITGSQHRQPQVAEWSKCKPGQVVGLNGFYTYIARYADGSADPPQDLRIAREGDWTLP